MTSLLSNAPAAILLILLQALAALPWLAALSWSEVRTFVSNPVRLLFSALIVAVVGVCAAALPQVAGVDRDTLETLGKVYGSVLHLQFGADFFVLVFAFLIAVWPKGAAVALAAFREGVRQPMFWLLGLAAILLMTVAPFVPYFTFGEDFVMMQGLGFDTVMLASLFFGVLAASVSISEEIEGRTAITLMSKPVSRRQFLIGKFVGILLASLVLTVVLGWYFNWMLMYKRYLDRMDPLPPLAELTGPLGALLGTGVIGDFVRGVLTYVRDNAQLAPGLVLGFGKVMVLVSIAVSLATRLQMIVNLLACLTIYFLGHLTPVLRDVAYRRQLSEPGSAVGQLLSFVAEVFHTLLPNLELFSLEGYLAQDAPMLAQGFLTYVLEVFGYCSLFTAIALLIGLILFEDRDLA